MIDAGEFQRMETELQEKFGLTGEPVALLRGNISAYCKNNGLDGKNIVVGKGSVVVIGTCNSRPARVIYPIFARHVGDEISGYGISLQPIEKQMHYKRQNSK